MLSLHQWTEHSWESVRRGRPLDWSRQPEVFKFFPSDFPRVVPDPESPPGRFLRLCCGVNLRRQYPGGTVFLRTVPSAGALYPCELYVQARGEPDLADGIYHYEPLEGRLCLLHRLASGEGLEACCPDSRPVTGLLLLVTVIPFRSSWKYGPRACRYCLLDSGHLLGTIEAAAAAVGDGLLPDGKQPEALTVFARRVVEEGLGLAGRELAVALVRCGRQEEGKTVFPAMALEPVPGCGSGTVDSLIREALTMEASCPGRAGKAEQPYARTGEALAEVLAARRSIRRFSGSPMEAQALQAVLDAARAEPAMDCCPDIRIHSVVNRVEGMAPGLYLEGECRRSGDLSAMAGYLCLEQPLGAESGVTFFLTAAQGPYLPLMLRAGWMGQRIYLTAGLHGLGCSGIGAFYDRETADFLGTDDALLYALAVGR